MEQDNEKEDKQERDNDSVRTAELVNGNMGDGSTEQSDDHSAAHTDRTDTESHTENEDSETRTESEDRNGEVGADHKVRAYLPAVICVCKSFVLLIYLTKLP